MEVGGPKSSHRENIVTLALRDDERKKTDPGMGQVSPYLGAGKRKASSAKVKSKLGKKRLVLWQVYVIIALEI